MLSAVLGLALLTGATLLARRLLTSLRADERRRAMFARLDRLKDEEEALWLGRDPRTESLGEELEHGGAK